MQNAGLYRPVKYINFPIHVNHNSCPKIFYATFYCRRTRICELHNFRNSLRFPRHSPAHSLCLMDRDVNLNALTTTAKLKLMDKHDEYDNLVKYEYFAENLPRFFILHVGIPEKVKNDMCYAYQTHT